MGQVVRLLRFGLGMLMCNQFDSVDGKEPLIEIMMFTILYHSRLQNRPTKRNGSKVKKSNRSFFHYLIIYHFNN